MYISSNFLLPRLISGTVRWRGDEAEPDQDLLKLISTGNKVKTMWPGVNTNHTAGDCDVYSDCQGDLDCGLELILIIL